MVSIIIGTVFYNYKFSLRYIYYFRVVLLLSSISPISLIVNLDLAKIWYSVNIVKDKEIPGTIARNSTIPEELGY